MKKILLAAAAAMTVSLSAYAQCSWTTTSNINTTCNVGIGTTGAPVTKLHVFGTGSTDGVAIDGTNNPALTFFNNSSLKAYIGLATVGGAYFSNTAANDLAIRSEGGSISLGRGSGTPGLVVAGSSTAVGGLQLPNAFVNSDNWFKPMAGTYNTTYSGASEAILNTISNQDANGAHIGGLYFTRSAGQSDAHMQIGGIQGRQYGTGTLSGGELWFFTKPAGAAVGADAARMVIKSDGNVGLGFAGPTDYLNTDNWFKPVPNSIHLAMYSPAGEAVLNAVSNQDSNGAHIGGLYFTRSLGQSDAHRQVAGVQGRQAGTGTLAGGELWFFTKPTGAALGADLARLVIKSDGKVVVGDPAQISATAALNVVGDINVSGNINAKYQDVAEWVDARGDLEPGTVVVLDPTHDDQVMPSASSYDTSVAGVVSASPGVILGTGAAGKEKIATTGRVKVRVDATRAPIRIGDLLVTSDVAGTAMRSEPLDVAGAKFHRPGTVIGKALQALPEGRGEILVLLSLQ